jgi:hypothetical protein
MSRDCDSQELLVSKVWLMSWSSRSGKSTSKLRNHRGVSALYFVPHVAEILMKGKQMNLLAFWN